MDKRSIPKFAVCGMLLALAMYPMSARAADAPKSDATTASTPAMSSEEAVNAAQRHYQRADELYVSGNYEAALVELERAYALAPAFRILYNIGLVNDKLGDHAAALRAFEEYLDQGGAKIPEERASQVREEIQRLAKLVATLTIDTDVPSAELHVDDVRIGTLPAVRQWRVNAGHRKISVQVEGRAAEVQVVSVAGGEAKTLHFRFEPAPLQAPAPTIAGPSQPLDQPRPESRPIPMLAWGITGALAAGTLASGVVALRASAEEDEEKERIPGDRAALKDARADVERWALITDVMLGATAVAAGVSLYLTLNAGSASRSQTAFKTRIVLAPSGIMACGEF